MSGPDDGTPAAEFDSFADNYSEALKAGLSVTGETQEYYAAERVRLTARRVLNTRTKIDRVLDFGCGQGSSTPLLLEELGASSAVGADVSDGLLEIARMKNNDSRVSYISTDELQTVEQFDCVYMNGVLHHVPAPDRIMAVLQVYNALRPGGLFALWENNPWNPGTRYVMSRIPFDRDAIMLDIPESQSLLKEGGFEMISTDTLFFFPRLLSPLRPLEKFLSPTRLGGQYMIVGRK
ncbi:MAG TPA: class I SAM-dependent methyltransferase [Gemmatimonadaceae bacterium]|nr:class I SAM-dependent methyltransferase [Gemmatimonadaceae bacterium]